ncbi:uncharacterized protein LOC101740462 [Bombyx mori]|uniref:Chitin-binding type-2 domain-containing protein n=1 Tax=Bombyx mori TaxID=7091 RepID=A0A8R1WNY8_BOMMO|nr:branchpoint-bridging protein [Bombyx mori]
MIKVLSFVLLMIFGSCSSQADGRQKRLLFYDEDGNLVKTYTNPYLRDLALHADKLPLYGNFLNPFFAFIRTSHSSSLPAFAIPVSNEIIQKIEYDPLYQQELIINPKKDPAIVSNPVCEGKRAQVQSPLTCNSFLNCWDGWSFEQDCPKGLMFSGDGYCDYAENVDCNIRTPSKPQIPQLPQPEPQPIKPAQPQIPPIPQTISPSPPQPPCIQALPPTLLPPAPLPPAKPAQPQSPATGPPLQTVEPLPPQQQPAHQHPQPPQPQVPQPQPPQLQPLLEPQPKCGQDFETFRSQFNCNVFFVCVNRQPVKFYCPADLAYSQILGVCDYPDRVECGKALLITTASTAPPQQTTTPLIMSSSPLYPELPKQEDSPIFLFENSNYNSQSWSTTNIAMSRSDAIRQVLLKTSRK